MRRDDARLVDMLLSAEAVLLFTQNTDMKAFFANRLIQSAVIRELEIIGEAARVVSADTKAQHPQIAWAKIIGMRHRIVHEYFDIQLELVWGVVQEDIPQLLEQLRSIVPPEPPVPPSPPE